MIELSIIICTYNRQEYITKALHSLTRQTLDNTLYEIIIINNNSTDKTDQLCRYFLEEFQNRHTIKYAIEPKAGLSNARNKGLEIAEGGIITYMDDDAIANEDFAQNILRTFEKNPAYDALGGKVLPVFPDGKDPEWLSKYLNGMVTKVDYGNSPGDFNHKYPAGCNMSFRKELFQELGPFNSSLTIRSDDKYMFLKLRSNNKKIVYAPDVIVHHHIDAYRLTPEYLKNQSYQIGYGEKLRLKEKGIGAKLVKFFEYVFKCGAAVILGIFFILKGKPKKAVYLTKILSRTFLGYLFIKPKF